MQRGEKWGMNKISIINCKISKIIMVENGMKNFEEKEMRKIWYCSRVKDYYYTRTLKEFTDKLISYKVYMYVFIYIAVMTNVVEIKISNYIIWTEKSYMIIKLKFSDYILFQFLKKFLTVNGRGGG